jgi:hypothetical protein
LLTRNMDNTITHDSSTWVNSKNYFIFKHEMDFIA